MKFYLPDFYYKYNLNTIIIDLLKKHPEYFYDNIEIGAIYGCFPGMIWNGGRLYTGFTDYDNIKGTIEAFNSRNIPIRFTCTNSLLEEKHNYDTYCNLVMDLANNGMNEILVNSPILEDYLRKTYPNYKYILSTTRCERDINKINQYTNEYHLVVTDYRDNDNFEFLFSPFLIIYICITLSKSLGYFIPNSPSSRLGKVLKIALLVICV